MPETVWLTESGKARLSEELHDLRTRRRPELHARIQEATESGDVSDNSEYEDLKDEWAILEARINELEHTLEHSAVIQREAPGLAEAMRAASLQRACRRCLRSPRPPLHGERPSKSRSSRA